MEAPILHHYTLVDKLDELVELLKHIRFVVVAGSLKRIQGQARYLIEKRVFGPHLALEQLTKPGSRFELLKVGPCLLSDHGMGAASMSIAIHELFLICGHAGVLNRIQLIRSGTCGGLGVEPGTVCLTRRALDPFFQDFIELKVCGKLVQRPCVVDQESGTQYERVALRLKRDFEFVSGSTVASNDFYEEQGRMNGAICEHSEADKMAWLWRAHKEFEVINLEMESNHLAAMCHKCSVSFVVVCVALCDRLKSDSADGMDANTFAEFERRLYWLNSEFMKDRLSNSADVSRTAV